MDYEYRPSFSAENRVKLACITVLILMGIVGYFSYRLGFAEGRLQTYEIAIKELIK